MGKIKQNELDCESVWKQNCTNNHAAIIYPLPFLISHWFRYPFSLSLKLRSFADEACRNKESVQELRKTGSQ